MSKKMFYLLSTYLLLDEIEIQLKNLSEINDADGSASEDS